MTNYRWLPGELSTIVGKTERDISHLITDGWYCCIGRDVLIVYQHPHTHLWVWEIILSGSLNYIYGEGGNDPEEAKRIAESVYRVWYGSIWS